MVRALLVNPEIADAQFARAHAAAGNGIGTPGQAPQPGGSAEAASAVQQALVEARR